MVIKIKKAIVILLLVILWLPLLQQLITMFPETQLKGAFTVPAQPTISFDKILSQQFQKESEDYINYKFGFRAILVKIKNSLEYILFKKITPIDQIEGEKGYIYSEGSINRTIGNHYNGKEKNDQSISDILFMKQKIEFWGGKFIAIIAPSKETIISEYLPQKYQEKYNEKTDYKDFIKGYKESKIDHIDFCAYFQQIKKTASYPLFTKTGFHWSVYAAALAQDSLLKHIQNLFLVPIIQTSITAIEVSDTARDSDADFETPMNLLFSLQDKKYFYPRIEIIPPTQNVFRPKAIIISDSFFWGIKNLKKIKNVFSDDSKFWFYFKTSLPLDDRPGVSIEEFNVIEELLTADIVIMLSSIGTIGEFPYGATEYFNKNYNTSFYASILNYANFDTAVAKTIISSKREIYIKTNYGKYLCADAAKSDVVIADRDSASSWERFSMFELSKNSVAISSFQNKYFSAELSTDKSITATREKIQEWEIFEKQELGNNQVAFKASNGKYLSLDNQSLQIFANADSIGKNEMFELISKK